ncbi:hypothetical protein Ccrd_025235 [Cynara cardunculus var. scolymus]|uniref:Hydroxyproline O-arabinosyltransferase-like domain-containing protein n=1 Tax=Cynara cardunculus var. scolymus TaxID=59895 RepID=A0A124SAH7_CYNCS|nr:hypothetical protein Ccrd_025235 [Cynara cardunculus var. scolymus]
MARKNMSCTSLLFLVLLAVGSFFATYNLITMIVRNKGMNSGRLSLDPIVEMPDNMKKPGGTKVLFHVALTATDAPYSKWQCRIMYYWYKKQKNMVGSEMGKFTRILHSGQPDNLMDEIPTFVVDPLPSELILPFCNASFFTSIIISSFCCHPVKPLNKLSNIPSSFFLPQGGYIVLNRPWAFVQWLERATIEEEYILMAEPDHIFVNPLPNLARGEFPAGFPFFYIKPAENEKIIRKYYPQENGPVTNIDPIGNSPVIIRKDLLEKIAPTWMNVSLRMKDDPETDKAFGWGELTYGKIGEWRFDKRSHLQGPPPRNLTLPPPGVPESVVTLVKMVNEATSNIPDWDTS